MRRGRSRRERGLSLIELMVSLAIGSLLIIGAVTVYSQSRATYRVSDTVSRLQENARYVFSVIEPDLQLAGYFGYTNRAETFSYITGGNTGTGIYTADLIPTKTAVSLGSDVDNCGSNFFLNLTTALESGNGVYGPKCSPAPPVTVKALADSLTVRRASADATTVAAGRLQLVTSRLGAANYIFKDGTMPLNVELKPDMIDARNLIVRTYYIADNTERPRNPPVPSLRVSSLVPGPSIMDEEVMSGVEDMQVQFGISAMVDTDANGIPDTSTGSAVAYVNTVPAGYQVVSVRIWLLMRAEQFEVGFKDTRSYQYADRAAFVPNDAYRRVLVSRTIQVRNSRVY